MDEMLNINQFWSLWSQFYTL